MHRPHPALPLRGLAAALALTAFGAVQAQSVPVVPVSATATGAKTYSWAATALQPAYTFDGKVRCDYVWCASGDDPNVKWAVVGFNGADFSVDLKPRPGATSEPRALWLKATGVTNLNAQLKIPMALVSEKRYRISGIVQASAAAKLKVGIGNAGVVTAARTVNVGTGATTLSVDLVFRPHEGGGIASLSFFPLDNGVEYYIDNLTISAVDADVLNLAGDLAFGKPTTAAPLAMNPLMFGLTANRWEQNVWPALGQSILRLWDNGVYWAAIEPQRGVYWETGVPGGPQPALARLSRFVNDYAAYNGAEVLYTMGISPPWAVGTCTTIYPPEGVPQLQGCGEAPLTEADWTRWSQYVYNMAVKYQGRVKYFELWNEPDAMFKGTAAQLVRLAQTARQALTQAEQYLGRQGQFKLVGPTPTSIGMSGLDDFLTAGGGQWIDIVSYHGYYTPAGMETRIAADVANVKLLMAAHGLGGKPIWNTEGAPGCGTSTTACPWGRIPPVEVQRGLHARALATLWTNGVSNFDYYFMEGTDNIHEPWRALVGPDPVFNTVTPNGQGFAKAVEWFKGAKLGSTYQMTGAPVVIQHITDKDNKKGYLLWNTSTQAITVKVPGIQSWWVFNAYDTLDNSYALGWDRQVTLQPMSPLLLR